MVAATCIRAAGWKVAVIDHRPFGGTCALRGCDPKKMLIGGTSAIDRVRKMHGKGVTGDSRIDWRDLMAFKRTFTDPVPQAKEQGFADKGIDAYHGVARFTGPNSIHVEGAGTLDARHMLLAFGAEPARLGIPGEEHLVTNEGFLSLDTMPRRVVLVGGGYIAAEFSHIAARSGAQVTILQHGERMLKAFDADLVGWLMESFSEAGIDVQTKTSVEAIEKTANGYQVISSSDGKQSVVEADLVVHAAGLTEAKAREQGLKFRVQSRNVPTWFTARQQAEPVYGFKVLVDEESDHILGAHLVGPHVDELVNLFALAIRHGLTAEDLKTTMFAYPTGASDIGSML